RRLRSASGMPSFSYVLRMSSGRSSQVCACFSVERTKYLMFSKSMPERSAPHVGMGFLRNMERPLSRFLSIHSGSLLRVEMSVTTSSLIPRRAFVPAASESDHPNSYWPRFDSSGRSMSTSDMDFLLPATNNRFGVGDIPPHITGDVCERPNQN